MVIFKCKEVLSIFMPRQPVKPRKSPVKKPRRTFGQKAKRFAIGVGVAGAIGAAGFAGTARIAEHVAVKGPERARPVAARVAESYKVTKAVAQKEVNSAVKTFGWQAFYRALGAACGAATVASILGGKTRTLSKKKAGGVTLSEKSSAVGIGGRTKSAIVGAAAIGGAVYPIAGISAAAIKGAYNLWRGMSPAQRERTMNNLQTGATKAKAAATKRK